MTTDEGERPGLVVESTKAIAEIAEDWLRGVLLCVTVVASLIAMLQALTAGSALWAVVGMAAGAGGVVSVGGLLLGHGSPLRTWLTMLTTIAFDLAVMVALGPR